MANRDSRSRAARQDRLDRFGTMAKVLSLLSDRELGDLVDRAPILGTGIGGTQSLLNVDGSPVFAKRVPLTDLERRPENLRSTANLFGMPVQCQYGVGFTPSFGVWRELAANVMATGWMLGGESASFPLMYHWRVLEGRAYQDALPEELADVDRAVAYWHGSSAVRRRIEAVSKSSASIALFLEYLPDALSEWLKRQIASGDDAGNSAIVRVEESLRTGVAFMNASGLFHFDAHFGNLRADDDGIYLADFGLATSPRFDLSPTETGFLARNISHDACHTITRLVDWLVTELTQAPTWQARDVFIHACAAGHDPSGHMFPAAASIIKRYAPVAVVINEFYRRLHLEDRTAVYPVAEVQRACKVAGLATPTLP